jgi:hypothetical protein
LKAPACTDALAPAIITLTLSRKNVRNDQAIPVR